MADRYAGYFEHNLDPKGRITIPAKYRQQLGTVVAMMRGKNCVELYSSSEWQQVYEKYNGIEREDGEAYDRMRKLLSTSVEDNEMDKQGRILMPPQMRSFAHLDKEIVISGAGRHLEVWNRDEFFRFIEDT